MLRVWDVKAMHYIFIKEQDIYEEPVGHVFVLSNLPKAYVIVPLYSGLRLLLGPGLLGVLGEILPTFRDILREVECETTIQATSTSASARCSTQSSP